LVRKKASSLVGGWLKKDETKPHFPPDLLLSRLWAAGRQGLT